MGCRHHVHEHTHLKSNAIKISVVAVFAVSHDALDYGNDNARQIFLIVVGSNVARIKLKSLFRKLTKARTVVEVQ